MACGSPWVAVGGRAVDRRSTAGFLDSGPALMSKLCSFSIMRAP